jgi:hypothetical protein
MADMRRFAFLSMLLACGCGSPTNHNPMHYGSVLVFLSIENHVGDTATTNALGNVAMDLAAIGPDFVPSTSQAGAQLTIRIMPFSGDCAGGGPIPQMPFMAPNGTTQYHEIWTVSFDNCGGDSQRNEALLANAIGTAIGMQSICTQAGGTAACPAVNGCSPVGYGPAVMNSCSTDPHPTQLDIAEYRRTHP